MDPSGSSYSLRRASPADAPTLIAMETSAFAGDRLSSRSLRRHIASSTADMVIATCKGAIAGYALAFYRKGSTIARLYSIAVDAPHRGKGLSARLTGDLETRARRRGCDRLRLEVRTDNAAAIRAYERQGFRSFGDIPDYYEDGATALRMEKTLRASNGKLAA
jgi:[ribosomal protein S18]-alanine N-acetyltransferase